MWVSLRWAAVLVAFTATAFTGCSNSGSFSKVNTNDYYVKSPTTKTFLYELSAPDGSKMSGTIRFEVTGVKWPDTAEGIYEMEMTYSVDLAGELKTKEQAVKWAPDEDLKKAMEPSNVSEVFRELTKEEMQKLGIEGGAATSADRSKVKSLKLPIIFKSKSSCSLTSGLVGSTDVEEEIAMVWAKSMFKELGISAPCATVLLDEMEEKDGLLMLKLVVTVDAGDEVGSYAWEFRRGTSLHSVRGVLSDGTTIMMTETEGGGK